MRSSLRIGSLALALTLAAGLAASAQAASNLTVKTTKSGSTLSLNGASVYTTAAAISNQRLITLDNSSKAIAVWNQTENGTTSGYFAISLDGSKFDQVQPAGNRVRTDYASFDPLTLPPAVPQKLRATEANELFFVQFVSTPLDEMRRDITQRGGTVERFMTDNTHIVRMDAATRAQVAALPYVRWVGEYHPAFKTNAQIREVLLAAPPNAPGVRYSIECMRRGPVQQGEVAALVEQLKGIVDVTIPDQFRIEATLTPDQLLAVLQSNNVNYIDFSGAPYGQDMDIVRQVGGAVPLLSGLNYQGQGVRGEVFDGGAVSNHQQWNGQVPMVRTTTAVDSHGTACYGINFATGTGNLLATGMLPLREQGIISRYQDTNQAGLGTGTITRLSLNQAAVNPAGTVRSCFQSSSVGSARVTTYTTVSAEVDDYLFQADYLSFQSQSNDVDTRLSRPQAWAKNIVSVGALDLLENTNPLDDVHPQASVGPADDFRVKPDLSHAFWNVFTTYTTGTTTYGQFSGTSSATPCTAGHGGLVLQMWHEGVWSGFGGGSSVFSDRPKSTTAKALMINNAYMYTPTATNKMYRAFIGWGRADLARMYNIRAKTFIVNETDVLLNAQTKTYNLTVAPGEPEFRATMIFSDPQGNPAAAQDRVNNLSLKVTSPGGTVYWGNNGMIPTALSGAGWQAGANQTVAGGAENTVDTVENVFLLSPAAGTWTVEVIATQVVQDARLETAGVTDADFALVVTGATPEAPPNPCYANCDLSTTTPLLTANDFQCFLNAFAAGASYANCDLSTTDPVLTANDFQCFLNAFAAGCS